MDQIIIGTLIFVVAVLMTMVGKGGGNFYVVILVMAGIPMHQAATTGQFILFAASIAAMVIFQKNKSISWSLALLIGGTTSLAALGGGYFSHLFSGFMLKLIFAFMLFAAGAVMFAPVKKEKKGSLKNRFGTIKIKSNGEIYGVNLWIASPVILMTGFGSGMVGVSGGSFLVPLMVIACGIPMHTAVGTASTLIAVTAFMGFLGHAVQGDFNPSWAVFLAIVTIAGGVIGGKFALKTKPKLILYKDNEIMNNNKIVILLGLLGFIVMADNWVVSPILPAISESLGIQVENAGILISAYMIPFGLFQIIFGPLADRFGKKQIITFSIVFFTLATGLCALAGSLNGLSIYRALTGVFAAAVMPISLALIGDLFPVEKRQMAIGTFMGIAFLGQGLSMITGGAIAYFLNWRGVFAVYAVLSFIPMLLLLKNYKNIPDTRNPDSQFVKPYIKLLSDTKSLYTYILVFLEGLFIIGSFSYLGVYISKTYHFNYLTIGAIMTAFGFMSLVGGRLGGKLVPKTGPRSIMMVGLAFASVADLLLFFAGQKLGVLIFSIGLLGIGFIFTHSTLLTRATQFADKARGAAMSLVAFCFMGGGGIGTAVGGKIASAYGFSNLFLIYGLMLFLTLAASFYLVRTQKNSIETIPQLSNT